MTDYNDIIGNIETVREAIGGIVAGLIADGFTETQARIITTGLFHALLEHGDD